ncbi:MAG: surface carbohydrate biosynthesis protein, partial [Gammaproteobacteria bacterium]
STFIFLWGEVQERVIKTRYDPSKNLVVTVGPRVDTWRPEFAKVFAPDISRLKGRYGDFILIICNWGYGQAEKDLGHDPDLIYPDIPSTYIRSAFMSLIRTLSKQFKNTRIIVRPHPSDLKDYWASKAKKFPANVIVIHEGSISPWIYAAKTVVHNNCTSGVEAWVGGTPVLAYCPYAESLNNSDLYAVPVNNLGIICRSEEEVVANIRTPVISERKSRRTVSDLAIEKFIYIDDEQLATEKILSSLGAMRIKPEVYRIPRYSWLKRVRALVGSGKWLLRDILGKSGMHTLSYTRYKNPGITIDELRDLVRRLAEIVDIQSDMLQIYQVDKDTFCIFSEEKLGRPDF